VTMWESEKRDWRRKAIANGHKVNIWVNTQLTCSACGAAARKGKDKLAHDVVTTPNRLWKKCGKP